MPRACDPLRRMDDAPTDVGEPRPPLDPDLLDETLVGTEGPRDRSSSDRYRAGAQLGRYVVIEQVGAGGMGAVFAAFDSRLGRKVALKILHPEAHGSTVPLEALRTRLLREAQAIAKLSHPNVISVYDVGTIDDAVFVAMEFVEGCTLSDWLRTRPPPDAVVEVFIQAGRGLAAAHLAGLVHRDFKPDNVLVGTDAQVRVSDFGLARAIEPATGASPESTTAPRNASLTDSDVLSSPLTQAGAVVGTPRYMAPEQHADGTADARSDQFAFCVALYRALYDQDPFVAHSLPRLALAKQQGRICPIPSVPGVPTYLEDIVLRGLAPDPEDRFASMQDVVAALERNPSTSRRKLTLMAAGVLVVGVTAASIGYRQARGTSECAAGDELLAGVWDLPRARAVQEAMLGTELPYAEQTWDEVRRGLDDYAGRWVEAQRNACEDTRLRGVQSDVMLDRKSTCLARRMEAFDALVAVLEEADAAVVERAAGAVSRLPSLASCANTEFVLAQVEPPTGPELASRVADIREALARVDALHAAGKYSEALRSAQNALQWAEQVEYAPVRAEALFWVGSVFESLGRYAEAETMMSRAVWAATRSKHDEFAARAATQLVAIVGDRLARHDDGLVWEQHARALLDRLGLDGVEQARLDVMVGNVHYRMGELDRARGDYERALARNRAERGADDPTAASWLINLGNVLHAQGEHEKAIVTYERAIELTDSFLGPGHPVRAVAQASMGIVHHDLGRYDQAERFLSAALPVLRSSMGEDHPFVAATLANLGLADDGRMRFASAVDRFDQALSIYERAVGTDHPDYARVLHNLGVVYRKLGRYDVAGRHLDQAHAIRRRAFGPDHAEVAASLSELAELDMTRERFGDAQRRYERAIAIYEAREADPVELGQARFGLARALAARGERVRAIETAALARAALDGGGARGVRVLEELDAWSEGLTGRLEDEERVRSGVD